MKVAVLGLWHLGSVVSACLAKLGIDTVAIDCDANVVANLAKAQAPVYEPGLKELIQKGLLKSQLSFSSSLKAVSGVDFLWICLDTPVDEADRADVEFVFRESLGALEHLPSQSAIVLSSQLPVQSASKLEALALERFPEKKFFWAVSPENLRLGSSLDVFLEPDRVVVGVRPGEKEKFAPLFERITSRLEWMGVESAEMTKHAINGFLATSVSFANEIARLAVAVGADPYEVARGLKTEKRIGKYAYLRPGPAFSGGTLARDLGYIQEKSRHFSLDARLSEAVFSSNDFHKQWLRNRLKDAAFGELRGKRICALGLTYKVGTDTLRRSASIELCKWALAEGAQIYAYDPMIKFLPEKLNINLCLSIQEALENADLVFLGTEHPEFRSMRAEDLRLLQTKPLLDPGEYLGPLENNISFRKLRHGK